MVQIGELLKVLIKYKTINIDNNVFRLHYKFTVVLLLLFAFVATSNQYFGSTIDCHIEEGRKHNLNTYCWVMGTFTIKSYLHGGEIGKTHIAPGVGPSDPMYSYTNRDGVIVHKYYQWVFLVLFLQAVFFYMPHYLWKIWEAGRLEMLIKDLGSPIAHSTWDRNYKEYLMKYMLNNNSYFHNIYVIRFTICEILNFINVTAQIFLMNLFFNGQFLRFGVSLIEFSMSADQNEISPLSHVFPKVAKCTYLNFGDSGSLQYMDALCVLPLNVINEKIFIILWVWFYLLAISSLFVLIYRISSLTSKSVRTYILMGHVKCLKKKTAYIITNNISFGDWFMLYKLGMNINPIIFKEFITDLGYRMSSKALMKRTFGVRV